MNGDQGALAQGAQAELGESLVAVPHLLPLDGDGRSVQAPVAPTEETARDAPDAPDAPDAQTAPVLTTWTGLRGGWRTRMSRPARHQHKPAAHDA